MSEEQRNRTESKVPVAGLNDNMEFLGRRLHVQTEHMDLPKEHIVTQVYSNGRVLLSKKTECSPDIHASQDFACIQNMMREQHYRVLQEIADKQARVLSTK